jgi:hypothetical protein
VSENDQEGHHSEAASISCGCTLRWYTRPGMDDTLLLQLCFFHRQVDPTTLKPQEGGMFVLRTLSSVGKLTETHACARCGFTLRQVTS